MLASSIQALLDNPYGISKKLVRICYSITVRKRIQKFLSTASQMFLENGADLIITAL